MHFSTLATVLSLSAVGLAAPALEKRTGGGGGWGEGGYPGFPQQPPSSDQTCNQNSVAYCNAGGDDWVHFGDNSNKCESKDVYCCQAGDKSTNIGDCSNILSGNTIQVPISALGGPILSLTRRTQWGNQGGWGGEPHPPPQTNPTCNQNSVAYCNAGGDDWVHWGDNNNKCSSENVFCCSAGSDSANAGDCSNIASGNTIKVPVEALGGTSILKARSQWGNQWGGQWGHGSGHPPPSSSQTCNQNSIAVCQAGGNDWIHAGDNNNRCSSKGVYCCQSGQGSLNLLSCSNVLSGNTISIPISILHS